MVAMEVTKERIRAAQKRHDNHKGRDSLLGGDKFFSDD
jgi:hypothetical protein